MQLEMRPDQFKSTLYGPSKRDTIYYDLIAIEYDGIDGKHGILVFTI